jgi:hypothetical protein
MKPTKRFKLGRTLSAHTRQILLLTATPHNGKEQDLHFFLSLLDGDRFEGKPRDAAHTIDANDIMRRMVKEQLVTMEGKPLFPDRFAYTVPYNLSPDEAVLYKNVTEYVCEQFNRADNLDKDRRGTVGFALTILQRRLASSPEAIFQSLRRRRQVQESLEQDPEVLILAATDAASEGINLHRRAHLMVNYDLPWNPNRIEQRFGRIHRIGPPERCHLCNLVAIETREGHVFHRLLEKLSEQRKALGGAVFDVLGKMFKDRSLRELLIEAIREGNRPEVKAKLDQVIDAELDVEHLRGLIEDRYLVHESLLHRDYFISAPWRIFIFDDRIELMSPGALPNTLTIENIRHGISVIRNPLIASFATKELPYRGIGTGIRCALGAGVVLQSQKNAYELLTMVRGIRLVKGARICHKKQAVFVTRTDR